MSEKGADSGGDAMVTNWRNFAASLVFRNDRALALFSLPNEMETRAHHYPAWFLV